MTELIKDKLYAIVVPENAKLHVRKESITIITDKGAETIEPKFDFEYIGFLTEKESSFNQVQFTEGKYSLRYLIESKGLYFLNPYEFPPIHEKCIKEFDKWQQSENNIIQKLLIIEKL